MHDNCDYIKLEKSKHNYWRNKRYFPLDKTKLKKLFSNAKVNIKFYDPKRK